MSVERNSALSKSTIFTIELSYDFTMELRGGVRSSAAAGYSISYSVQYPSANVGSDDEYSAVVRRLGRASALAHEQELFIKAGRRVGRAAEARARG